MFPYVKILQQAYWLTKNYKFLWLFGLFLGLWESLNAFNWNLNSTAQAEVAAWLLENPVVPGLFLLILFPLLYLYFSSQAGIIFSVNQLMARKPAGFKEGWKGGQPFACRLFKASVVIGILSLAAAAVLGIPIMYLWSSGFHSRALILAGIGLLIFLPVYFVLYSIGMLAPLHIVLFDLKVKQSFMAAFDMIKLRWIILLVFGGLLFLISMVFMSIVVILGNFLYYLVGQFTSSTMLIAAVACGAVIFLVLAAVLGTFVHSAQTLLFLELVRPPKALEESQAEVVPETIS